MTSVYIYLIVILVVIYILSLVVKPKNYPPGPQWCPFVGCSGIVRRLTQKHKSQWRAFYELSKQYSTNVLGLRLGGENLVVVYGEKNVQHAFSALEFDGRPNSFFIKLRCFGKKLGITFTDGPLWKEHRNFTVKYLKNVGFGKAAMEKDIQKELSDIIQKIKNSDAPIVPKDIFPAAVMNVLWKSVAGERINEERLKFLLDLFSARSKAFSMAGGWLNEMPWSRFIFPDLSGYTLIAKINQQISDVIEEAIVKHKSKLIEGKDFIYYFLKEINENKSTFTEEQLKMVCVDLLIAGSQTTSNTLEFAIVCLLRYQEIQEKMYHEINSVLGDTMPCYEDSQRLIYTSAFILEVQRYYTIVPLVGPRRLLSDVVMDGYTIPKETTVLMSVYDLHFDPKLWDEPQEFKPERFINENGEIKIPPYMYHFGCGRRRCPGDALAKQFIFIVLVGLLQKFKINESASMPPTDPVIGLLMSPKLFSADFVLRE